MEIETLEEASVKGVYKYLLTILSPFNSNSANDSESGSPSKKRKLDLNRDHAVKVIRKLLTKSGNQYLATLKHLRESLWNQYQDDAGKQDD